MKYIALLRGINVGGKNIIKMSSLREAFEKCGFKNVSTFIQSGNVVFESDEKDIEKIVIKIEEFLSKTFNADLRVVIRSFDQLKTVVTEVPKDWKKKNNLRCYIAFVKEPTSEQDVLREIKLKEGIDFIDVGQGVLYMSTLLSGLTKSGFTKLVGTKIYKDITIRNYSTAQKLVTLMERD